jgi:hypothetical protein
MNLVPLASEVFCLLNDSVVLSVLVLLDSELGVNLFLFFCKQVLGVRFGIQLCLKTTKNQLEISLTP